MTSSQNPGLILSELTLELVPCQPAIYAILSDGESGSTQKKCRYVGFATNLREAVLRHFQPSEPIIPLRYFMLSSKLKYLQYELIPVADKADKNAISNLTEEWMEGFNMASASQEKEDMPQLNFS